MGIYEDTLPGYLSNIAIENGDLVRWWIPSYKMVDLSSSLWDSLPEGTNYEAISLPTSPRKVTFTRRL